MCSHQLSTRDISECLSLEMQHDVQPDQWRVTHCRQEFLRNRSCPSVFPDGVALGSEQMFSLSCEAGVSPHSPSKRDMESEIAILFPWKPALVLHRHLLGLRQLASALLLPKVWVIVCKLVSDAQSEISERSLVLRTWAQTAHHTWTPNAGRWSQTGC